MALLMLINYLNPLHTGGLFHYYMLDNSIFHLGCKFYFVAFNLFLMENPVSKECKSRKETR